MGNILWSKSSAPGKDDTTSWVKRKTCLDSLTPINRKRLSESDDPTTSEECFSAREVKRKATEDGEGKPTKKEKKGRLDLNLFGKESASSSKHSGKESCNTSVEDVRVGKRKATTDDEGPQTKKKRRTDLKKTSQSVDAFRVYKRKAVADEEGPTFGQDLKKIRQSLDALRAEFEAKYKQQDQLAEGGCGTVFAGYRKADNLPVAIKHIPKENILYHVDGTGKQLSVELAIMLKLGDKTSRSVGMSALVSLLDWYDLDQELILVMERPIPAEDLHNYIEGNGGSLPEQEAKIILKQLVDVAIDLEKENIFHRDIKTRNILIETSSDVPRVRLIDFGVSRFVNKGATYRMFCGTLAYIPPEWWKCRRYRAGPTSVWQVGGVLYDTLHSDVAFSTNMYLRHHVKISETLSENCLDFLRRCFTIDPKQRPTLEQSGH